MSRTSRGWQHFGLLFFTTVVTTATGVARGAHNIRGLRDGRSSGVLRAAQAIVRVRLQHREHRRASIGEPRSLVQLSSAHSSSAQTQHPTVAGRGPAPVEVFGTIYVGTPAQNFTVAFDTGSGNILLPATKCKSIACLSHRTYNPALSATSKDIAFVDQMDAPLPKNGARDIVKMSVAAGTVVGDLMRDKVCLGNEENLCATMGIYEATEMSDEPFSLFSYDGIFGLGMPGTSLEKEFNYMAQLTTLQALEVNRFAVWLAMPQDDGEDSEVTFGSAAEERIGSAEVLWRPVSQVDTGLWQTILSDVAVDSVKLGLCEKDGCQAAFDTGTGVIAGPTNLIHAVLSSLHILPDCTNFFDLPPLGFAFGGVMLNIEPVDYVKKTPEGACYHQFLALDIPPPKGPMVLLGIPFLQRYYTIYDSESLQIGIAFAKHKRSTKEGETTQAASERLMVRFQGATEHSALSGGTPSSSKASAPKAAEAQAQTPAAANASTPTWGGWVLQLLGDQDNE